MAIKGRKNKCSTKEEEEFNKENNKEGNKGSGGFGWRFKLRRRRIRLEVARLRGRNIDSNSGRDGRRIFKMRRKNKVCCCFFFL
jgi:hypothetical protein